MKQVNNGNDTAKKIYNASVGEESSINTRGVQMYERPYLWRDDTPCSHKDTPTENFIPTPALNTNDGPKWKRILGIVVAILIAVISAVCFFVGVIGSSY